MSQDALGRLEAVLATYTRLVVAFSAGVDSTVLAAVARRQLGREAVLAVTASSDSLASQEAKDADALARHLDLRWQLAPTQEMLDPRYRANDSNRCYYCKTELMRVLSGLAAREHAQVALGVNLDDLADFRPGQAAAAERGAVFPLVDARLDKDGIRRIARLLRLPNADKPAQPCLASRIPYGQPVSTEKLRQIAETERAVAALGFDVVRVRHHGALARIEIPIDRLHEAVALRSELLAAVRAAGFRSVTLDLAGFRSGSLNEELGVQGRWPR